ncbi:MAG TPA: hypothetical protein VFC99_18130 [Acidimicrobiia bacterium]|nr:hypothetical protein [Acidimicrobiia bacterium]
MRSGRLAASLLAVATAVTAGALGFSGTAVAATRASVAATDAKSLAVEVCEDMVRDAVISASGGPLASPQTGGWKGSRYTCTYPLTGGRLVLRVDVYPTHKKAQAAYTKASKKTKVDQNLLGIGERALLAKDGHVVAEKDRFVLVADPSKLPPKLSKPNLSLAAVEAVLSCWVGTGSSS